MIDEIMDGHNRAYATLLASLALISFLLYAAGVLMLRQDRGSGWLIEISGSIPSAVSHLVYGAPFAAVDSNVFDRFVRSDGRSVQDTLSMVVERPIQPGVMSRTTQDGGGVGMDIFATVAMAIFGARVLSLVLLYLLTVGISVIVFIARFHDRRLIAVPLYFLAATVMLLTPLGTSADAVAQMPIGGQRYFAVAAILPAVHIFFEIVDRSPVAGNAQQVVNALLLLLQALFLFAALLARSSAGYLLVGLCAAWLWRLYRERAGPAQRRALQRTGAAVVGALAVWAVVIVTTLLPYVTSGRLLGNVWHRAFISFSLHPDWPFGDLRNIYNCTKYIPEGLNRRKMDRNGHCVWWVYPPNAERDVAEVLAGVYGSEYEKAMRQAYFYVIEHYPRQAFELYVYVKSSRIRDVAAAAWYALFALPQAPVPLTLFMVAVAQVLLFVAFVVAVALRDRSVIDLQLAVFLMFLLLSLPPLYVAWATPWTTSDVVLLIYSCQVLAVVLLAQVLGRAIMHRALPPPVC